MKKTVLLLALMMSAALAVGCGKEKTPETTAPQSTSETAPAETQTETEAQKIANEKPVFLYYMDYGSSTAQRIKTFETAWTDEEDIGIFAALAVDRSSFAFEEEYGTEIGMQQETWDSVDVPGDYKIGYQISFDADGEHKVYTILSPADVADEPDLFMGDVDSEEVTGYLGVWLYDDYHQDGGFYDHVDPDEYDDDTLLTSIKLRLTPDSDVVSNLVLEAFSYSSTLEFDSDGHYNSVYGSRVSIVEE